MFEKDGDGFQVGVAVVEYKRLGRIPKEKQ